MQKKILVVDDELHIVQLLASRLRANNYKVTAACDGVQALRVAHKENPDLIILDIKMPAGGGISVYDSLRKSVDTIGIPVIFITAFPNEDIRKQTLEMGAVDFIAKPFSSEDLLSKIKRILGE